METLQNQLFHCIERRKIRKTNIKNTEYYVCAVMFAVRYVHLRIRRLEEKEEQSYFSIVKDKGKMCKLFSCDIVQCLRFHNM